MKSFPEWALVMLVGALGSVIAEQLSERGIAMPKFFRDNIGQLRFDLGCIVTIVIGAMVGLLAIVASNPRALADGADPTTIAGPFLAGLGGVALVRSAMQRARFQNTKANLGDLLDSAADTFRDALEERNDPRDDRRDE